MMKYKEFKDNEYYDSIVVPALGLYDAAAQTAIEDHFDERRLCDDPQQFAKFFARKLRLKAWEFTNALRIESIQFDPFVLNYLEEEYNIKRNDSTENILSKISTVNKQSSYADEVTGTSGNTSNTQSSGTSSSTGRNGVTDTERETYTDTKTREASTTSREKDINSQFAQSNPGNLTINPDVVDVNYATTSNNHGQNTTENSRDDDDSTTNRSKTSEGNTSESGNVSGTSTTTDSGNTTQNAKGSANEQTTNNQSGTETATKIGNEQLRKIQTGRSGKEASELIKNARAFYMTASCTEWLLKELSTCFMAQLEVE